VDGGCHIIKISRRNMKQTPVTFALGCGGSLILLGSFVSGFYLGHSQKAGHPVNQDLANIIKYGPAIIGGAYGAISANAQLSVPENLEEIVENAPPNINPSDAAGCTKGCGPILSGIIGVGIVGGATYLGYVLGHAMG
jgi:hypothetical protein